MSLIPVNSTTYSTISVTTPIFSTSTPSSYKEIDAAASRFVAVPSSVGSARGGHGHGCGCGRSDNNFINLLTLGIALLALGVATGVINVGGRRRRRAFPRSTKMSSFSITLPFSGDSLFSAPNPSPPVGSQILNSLNGTIVSLSTDPDLSEDPFFSTSHSQASRDFSFWTRVRDDLESPPSTTSHRHGLRSGRQVGSYSRASNSYYYGSMPAASSSSGGYGGCGCCCGKGGNRDEDLLIGLLALAAAAALLGVFNINGRKKRDLANDLDFIDENEMVLRMLDDLMMTYKYGYVPKCSQYHICKLNKAAAYGGGTHSTVIPLVSLPAAWILGKPTSNVMDFLHAVWLGRNEKDCDDAFPECSRSQVFGTETGGNSTIIDSEPDANNPDDILASIRYLEDGTNAPGGLPVATPSSPPEVAA